MYAVSMMTGQNAGHRFPHKEAFVFFAGWNCNSLTARIRSTHPGVYEIC